MVCLSLLRAQAFVFLLYSAMMRRDETTDDTQLLRAKPQLNITSQKHHSRNPEIEQRLPSAEGRGHVVVDIRLSVCLTAAEVRRLYRKVWMEFIEKMRNW